MKWFDEFKKFQEEQVAVEHEPETVRYARARGVVDRIVRRSVLLGRKAVPEGDEPVFELALWYPPERGRGFGYYSCFRVFFDGSSKPVFAILYCFYDGKDKSPGFKSEHSAREYARFRGFEEECDEEND